VLKKSKKKIKGYGYVGTGNFNETTAKFYTDHALFTARAEVLADLRRLFTKLAKEKEPPKNPLNEFDHLLVSQYNMVSVFEDEINRQIKRKQEGFDALIRIKINNLENVHMIDLLYKASQQGVTVDLVVRSICCISPGREGLSENIKVKRIVDRFLEHSRIFIFGKDADQRIYIGSADWMTRNLHHRIEVCAPVPDERLKKELVDYFDIQWNDRVKAVNLDADGNQVKQGSGSSDEKKGPQEKIFEYLKNR
jgi:polyphosphate kinase